MMQDIIGAIAGVAMSLGVWLGIAEAPVAQRDVPQEISSEEGAAPTAENTEGTASKYGKVLSHTELLALADNKYAEGGIPLGDKKYSTTEAKKGYIYLCRTMPSNGQGGAQNAGSWIHGTSWNPSEKVTVSGSVSWPQATFSNSVTGANRILAGNGLPTTHATGIYPVQRTDAAYAYDRNPNSISEQSISQKLPIEPVYSETPSCIGGQVGIMLNGTPIFNGFDALMLDAVAHEVQDLCDGHPEITGQYHYHGKSRCTTDTSVTVVLGYAYDGFPITGDTVAENKYLTTEDLDMCHGITSEIVVDGKKKTTYHYVLTQDFPYSVGCYRGKTVTDIGNPAGAASQVRTQTPPINGSGMTPPQEAVTTCMQKKAGNTCSFIAPRGDTISGTCVIPPSSSTLTCVPDR